MYSKDNEPQCGICVYSELVKGIATHVRCQKRNEYVAKSRNGCESYKYDIFKRKVARKKDDIFKKFSADDFKL